MPASVRSPTPKFLERFLMMTATNSWASLLRAAARAELSRLEGSSREAVLRKALAARRRSAATGWNPVANPCPWWTPELDVAHRAWLEAAVPMPVPYEQLDPCRQWCAGQPVLLRSSGHDHIVWVRLNCSASFGQRWLSGSIPDRQVSGVTPIRWTGVRAPRSRVYGC